MSTRLLAGRYELIERIGEGGMAVVYRAKDRLLNRFVAVKILKPEFTKDVKVIESFRRESQAAASLSHPNIVNVYDVGKEGNIHYIVMELIEGNVLSDVIRAEGALDPRRAVSIAKQIASALSLAHKNQIIHRDVKPHNILITADGVAKITDFGIAKAVSTSTVTANQTGTIMGSVHYFSPEQARGGYVDEKSDIYSLGIVLYEMLTGKVPFDADNPVAVAVMHMNEDILPPSQVNPAVSPDVEAIVMKATAKYQVNRYKTADEMITALNLVNYHPAAQAGGVAPALKGEDEDMKQGKKNGTGSENGAGGKKKKKIVINKAKLGAVILAVILAVPASSLAFQLLQDVGQPKEIEVPNLLGSTEEEAKQTLEEMNLAMEVGIALYDEQYGVDEIVGQNPQAGSKVKEGHIVTINLNKERSTVSAKTIPNLSGKTVDDARYSLEAYGYSVGSVTTEFDDLPEGIIISQSPAANTEAEEGTKVNLVVSKGKDNAPITMVNLVGMDASTAASEISRLGLKLGDSVYEESDTYETNKVIHQSVTAGDPVEKGTTVVLTISTGLKPKEPEIKSVAFEISYDAAQNEMFFLSVVVSDATGVTTPIKQRESYKIDGSEVISVSGQGQGTIQIIFDNDVVQQLNVNFDTGEVY